MMHKYANYIASPLLWSRLLPAHWDIKRLKLILQERKENNLPVKTNDILSLTNTRGVIPYSQKGNLGNKSKENIEDYHLAYPNDLVLNSMNVIIGSVGVSKYFGAISPVYYALLPRENDNIRYFEYIFKLPTFEEVLKGLGNGILEIRKRIPMIKLNGILLPVPPRDEQDQIVRFLDWKVSGINKLINIKKKEIKELNALKRSMISHTVTHGLNPNVPIKFSGVKWFVYIPIHWKCKKVGALFQERKIKVSDKDYEPLSVAKIGIVPQLDTAAKTDAGDNRKLVCIGDFVINSRSDRKGSCGVSKLDGSVSLINIVLTPRRELNGDFVHYLMRSHTFSEEYYRNGRGIVADLWTTRYSEMKSIVLPIPPHDEQDQIVSYLDKKISMIDAAIASKQEQIKTLQDLKIVLISNAVTGQIDVRDIEIPEYERNEENLDEDADAESETEEIEEQED